MGERRKPYAVVVMRLRVVLSVLVAIVSTAGCGGTHHAARAAPKRHQVVDLEQLFKKYNLPPASGAATPDRLQQLIERHQKFPTGVPKLGKTGAPKLENLVPQKTLTIR
jgi:hypothetical protein